MEDTGFDLEGFELPFRNYPYRGKIKCDTIFTIEKDQSGKDIADNFSDDVNKLEGYYDNLLKSNPGDIALQIKKLRHLANILSIQETKVFNNTIEAYYNDIIALCELHKEADSNVDVHMLSTYVALINRYTKRGRTDDATKYINLFRGHQTTNTEANRFRNSIGDSCLRLELASIYNSSVDLKEEDRRGFNPLFSMDIT